MQLQQLGLSGYGYSPSPSGSGAGATGGAPSGSGGAASGLANGLDPSTPGLTSSAAALADVRESESLDIQLADGTQVTLRMRAHATALGASQTLSDGTTASAAALIASGQLQIEVKGNLSSDDLSAINNVVSQVDSLASQFFSGDAQGAFAAAASLNMDPAEIAGFSLKLSYSSELFQQAAGAASDSASSTSSATPTTTPQQTIINFVQQAMTKLRVSAGGSSDHVSSHWKMKLLAQALPAYANSQATAPAQDTAAPQPATGVTALQSARLAAATLNTLAEH